MRYILLFITLSLAFSNSIAQTNIFHFSGDSEEFLPSMEEIFKTVADKKYAKTYIEELELFWYNPEVTEEDKKLIITNCNLIAQKKARPIPDYETYLNTVRAFILSDISADNFMAWNNAIVSLMKKKRYPLRKINQLLNLTNDLLSSNAIYSTPSTKWVASNKNWSLKFDKDLEVIFDETNLCCFAKNDSIHIFDTQGVFNYTDNTWRGSKGKVTWERSGFSADSVYAVFDAYIIPFKNSFFEIPEVKFFNYDYFDHALTGSLEHKVMNISNPQAATYPKFLSTQERFHLDNIHPNINYEGGFAQNGAKFLGAGTFDNPAKITIFRHDTLFITARSLYFALRKDQILSTDTEVRLRLDTGYIYHPGLIFKLMIDDNELHLIRNGEGLAISPYFNTYHNVSMDIELLSWKIDNDIMDLKMISGAAENHGSFESLSYFREAFFNQLQGMDAIHPLQGLKNCSNYYRGQNFTAEQYAQMIGLPVSQVRQQAIKLSFYGFIGYNVNTDEIEIRQRLNDYLMFRVGKKDYDVIRFTSNTPGKVANATLDLKNYDLNINGVKSISISDHQNVIFFPENQQILLKRNRNFVFNGAIIAGMLNLYGAGFKFDYDNFRIEMSDIDSLRMKVQTGELDYFGQQKLTYVRNAIEELSGTLQIDKPDNKSGKELFSQFPILHSSRESFVYYDKNEIQNGAYNKDKFYFRLDTFTMDSINTLTRKNFDFSGTFVSNIFPTFKENLTVQQNYSLGFTRNTPPEGYEIYDHRATFTSRLDLSNDGLRGNGTLDYLTSTSKSEDFVFLPEEVNGLAYSFVVDKQTEGVEYPDVTGKYNEITYKPFKEELRASTTEETFTMYENEANLNGALYVTKQGATGKGTFYMDNANIESPAMTFESTSMIADSSDFNLVLSEDIQDVSFNTTNLISNIDFETRKGTFVSKEGGSLVNFTHNKYISYISEFSWDMDLNDIFMGSSGSEGNRFISTHRKQDSLQFRAPLAKYDVENNIIYAEEVKDIKVADANILLKDGKITIREDADMAPLDSTTIVLSDSTHTHTIYNSHLKIEGKYAYSGYGQYDYTNGDGKKYTIQMSDISLNEDNRTIANGNIPAADLFTFNKRFTFKGRANLLASDPLFTFDGGVQMLHQCVGGPQTYVRFDAKIDPNNVVIPIGEESQNYERENIYKDFFLTKDSAHVYSSFLQDREDYSDIPMITGGDYLHFNEANNAYEITSLAKINNPDTTGVVMCYSNNDCNITGNGELDFAIELDQVKTRASGTIVDSPDKEDIFVSTFLSIDFFFNDLAIDQMFTTIMASSATDSKQSDKQFIRRTKEIIGKKAATTAAKDRKIKSSIEKQNEELNKTLVFSNIDFSFDGKKHAYIADGKADLAFIKSYAINKQVDVKAEITRKRSGNSLELFMQFDDKNWFFYSYKAGMMQTVSSSDIYNNTIQTLDSDERKLKTGLGEKSYTFILAPSSKLNRFLKKFGLPPIKTSSQAGGQSIGSDEEEEETDE